jgi:hypothetical protein
MNELGQEVVQFAHPWLATRLQAERRRVPVLAMLNNYPAPSTEPVDASSPQVETDLLESVGITKGHSGDPLADLVLPRLDRLTRVSVGIANVPMAFAPIPTTGPAVRPGNAQGLPP